MMGVIPVACFCFPLETYHAINDVLKKRTPQETRGRVGWAAKASCGFVYVVIEKSPDGVFGDSVVDLSSPL